MITGNKGEWSEVYTFLKLLSDGKVHAGDKDLNKLEDVYYIILKVLKKISDEKLIFDRQQRIKIIDGESENVLSEFDIEDFKNNSLKLFEEIRSASGSSFSVPGVEEFLSKIRITSIKAKSTDKTDINIIVHDPKVNTNLNLGFSIKSQLGSPSTLLNAGKTTNFIYRLTKKLSNDQINTINRTSAFKDKIKLIENNRSNLEFSKVESDNFELNLQMIDTQFPKIVACMLYNFYSDSINKFSDSVEKLEETNPLNFGQKLGHKFYTLKTKRFMTAVALGMTPAKLWNGNYEAQGGFLVVKDDGEILCYHIYHQDQFEEYLLSNTKFETASTTRYEFGKVYDENNEQFFKLNLQIRFIK